MLFVLLCDKILSIENSFIYFTFGTFVLISFNKAVLVKIESITFSPASSFISKISSLSSTMIFSKFLPKLCSNFINKSHCSFFPSSNVYSLSVKSIHVTCSKSLNPSKLFITKGYLADKSSTTLCP